MIGSFQGNFHWKVITMTCKMILHIHTYYMYLKATLIKIIYTYNKDDTIIAHVQISYEFLFCRDHVQRCVSFLGHLAEGQEYKEVYLEGV